MKAILVLVAAIAFAIAPFLSPEFGGFDPNRYPVPQNDPPVQPIGWAFSIWGIIYLGLIFHAAVGVYRFQNDENWNQGRIPLFISLAVGAAWLPVALISPIWATVMIWIMLVAVLFALYQTQSAVPNYIANLPVALYAGWLSAASFVSIGLLLGGYGFLSEPVAAIVSLVLAGVFALYNQLCLKHWTYGFAVAWGFFGIAVANLENSLLISSFAFIAVAIIATLVIYQLKRQPV